MPNFQMLAEGSNYPGNILGFDGRACFYMWVYVRALNATLAEYKAMDVIRGIESFKKISDSDMDNDNRAYVKFSSVEQISMLPRQRTSTLYSAPRG